MEIEGREKLGEVAALLLDDLEEFAERGADEDGVLAKAKVEEVVIVVELETTDPDGHEFCQVRIKSSHTSPVYKRGLLAAGLELINYDNE